MFCSKFKLLIFFSFILFSTVTFSKPIKIVSITDDFAAIAKAIGGDHVKTVSLIQGSRNLHHVTPKPSMVFQMKSADILIRLGMDTDKWIDELIQVAKNSHIIPGNRGYIDASIHIDKLEVPSGKIDGLVGDVHAAGNPHYWLDPRNGIIIANTIRDTLISIDSKNKAVYDSNYNAFKTLIELKYIEWKAQLQSYVTANFISYHKVWSYFFAAFDLTSIGELERLPGIPPSAKHLMTLKKEVLSLNEPVILIGASFYPTHVVKSFADTVDAPYKILFSNVGEADIMSYDALFDYLIQEITQ